MCCVGGGEGDEGGEMGEGEGCSGNCWVFGWDNGVRGGFGGWEKSGRWLGLGKDEGDWFFERYCGE